MSRLTVDHHEVRDAFRRLIAAGKNPRPALMGIGETLTFSTKQRFATSTGPDGKRWEENSDTTLLRHLGAYKGSFTKRGSLTKKGAARLGAKKPLIGETKALSRGIAWQLLGNDAVAVGSPMEYAAVQQLGAKKGAFGTTRRGAPIPWGDIPARPFLGISAQDHAAILETIADYLLGGR